MEEEMWEARVNLSKLFNLWKIVIIIKLSQQQTVLAGWHPHWLSIKWLFILFAIWPYTLSNTGWASLPGDAHFNWLVSPFLNLIFQSSWWSGKKSIFVIVFSPWPWQNTRALLPPNCHASCSIRLVLSPPPPPPPHLTMQHHHHHWLWWIDARLVHPPSNDDDTQCSIITQLTLYTWQNCEPFL